MINDSIYQQQIELIEGAYNFRIADVAVKAWKIKLDEEGYTSQDLMDAVNTIIHMPGKYPRLPNLGNILEECQKAADVRYQKERYKEKKTNINHVNPSTEMGKRALKLIQLMLKGYHEKDGEIVSITKRDKIDYMLKMDKFYPGKGWQEEAMALRKELRIEC